MTTKHETVNHILSGKTTTPAHEEAVAFAPANIALCKYWGKRDEELNLPVTSSLSISLNQLGSEIRLRVGSQEDTITLNDKTLPSDSTFVIRLKKYLDMFRSKDAPYFTIHARNTIPTAAGFASSASGFAAMVKAINTLFGWGLDKREQSILARLGSGSASRSLYDGFVEWYAGESPDGLDSYAEPLKDIWPDLCIGLFVVSKMEKPIGSRPAMKRTVQTCPLYVAWPPKVDTDLIALKSAIQKHDFQLLGETAESNALTMHATMISSWPPVLYWQPESVRIMHTIWQLRNEGLPLYFTMDAGPNLKLLFLKKDADTVKTQFPDIQVVEPFNLG